jgi:hypothetical protein
MVWKESGVRDEVFTEPRQWVFYTVYLVQFLNMEGELSLLDYIVIEFIPIAESGELWPRTLSQRMEEEPVNAQCHPVDGEAE